MTKKGFVQKEIRQAIDVLMEYPPGQIYIIPARLNFCHPLHERIAELNWVDLFPVWDLGIKKIVKAIKISNRFKKDR